MRLQAYLISEGRGKALNEEEAKTLLKKNCKQALNGYTKGNMLYRGNKLVTKPYLQYKPKGVRASRNTSNYYTLLISNSSKWKSYPRRDKSFICTSSFSYAISYGTPYGVFPYDGAVVGVASTRDFWGSFMKSMALGTDMDDWNMMFKDMFSSLRISINDDKYSSVTKAMNEFDSRMKSGKLTMDMVQNAMTEGGYALKEWAWFKDVYKGSFLEVVDKTLDPNTNGFQLMKVGGNYPDNKECWVSSECIFVKKELVPSRPNPLGEILKDLGYSV